LDLIGLDSCFKPVRALRCTNIQWNRRYYEAGDFQLQLRAADFDVEIAYVYAGDRPETGMVEKVETEHTLKGDFVLVSGYFLEGMLNWKAVYPRYQSAGNLTDTCRALVGLHLADAGVCVPAATALGTAAAFDALGDPLGDVTFNLLKLQELSQRIRLDYESETLVYEVWQGLDRTQSGGVNPYAVFSQGFGTVDTLTLTRDTSDWRNYAIAVYDGGVLTVDGRTAVGEPARVLYLDTGMGIENGQTQAAFLAAVDTAARAELAKYSRLVNIDATVLQNNTRYLADYDLGDKCDVRDDRLGLAFEARIIEINEVFKENTHTVSLQFGDKIPKAYIRERG